tara:strand:- start:724 stop:894 length:171 start_codon:yes stop_codon:yes gene_type:complete
VTEDEKVPATLNMAGYTTLGVARGFARVIVPVAVLGLAYGMSLKVLKSGVRLGRVE